ncbi:hypothetical protein FB451DRAFT_1268399 [Mycena latifolia]|nr:hypothetical protein FB451DRAFT_1268399 [Mycena latifolia]
MSANGASAPGSHSMCSSSSAPLVFGTFTTTVQFGPAQAASPPPPAIALPRLENCVLSRETWDPYHPRLHTISCSFNLNCVRRRAAAHAARGANSRPKERLRLPMDPVAASRPWLASYVRRRLTPDGKPLSFVNDHGAEGERILRRYARLGA